MANNMRCPQCKRLLNFEEGGLACASCQWSPERALTGFLRGIEAHLEAGNGELAVAAAHQAVGAMYMVSQLDLLGGNDFVSWCNRFYDAAGMEPGKPWSTDVIDFQL